MCLKTISKIKMNYRNGTFSVIRKSLGQWEEERRLGHEHFAMRRLGCRDISKISTAMSVPPFHIFGRRHQFNRRLQPLHVLMMLPIPVLLVSCPISINT